MAALPPDFRHEVVGKFVDEAKINPAHLYIGQLMYKGYVDRVLTTNFDPLVAKACAMFNRFPAVYDMTGQEDYIAWRVGDLAIFHLHGQRNGFFQAHTDEAVNALRQRLNPVFVDSANSRTWVVVGYSGENDPVFKYQLATMPEFGRHLYWVLNGDQIPPHLKEFAARESVHFILNQDADSFFENLATTMGIGRPPVIYDPAAFLAEVHSSILMPDGAAATPLTGVGLCGADPDTDCEHRAGLGDAASMKGDASDMELEARVAALALAEDLKGIIELGGAIISSNCATMRSHLAWAHWMLGDIKDDQSRRARVDDRDALLDQAIAHYRAAVNVDERCGRAHSLWGIALARKVKILRGRDRSAPITAMADEAVAKAKLGAEYTPSLIYNLACVYGLIGDLDNQKATFMEAHSKGLLPRKEVLLADPDVVVLKAEEWLVDILADMEG
ncbi:MAG: SIR2 family protein [Actinomycetota bacterium]